jgi:hypothetical protein
LPPLMPARDVWSILESAGLSAPADFFSMDRPQTGSEFGRTGSLFDEGLSALVRSLSRLSHEFAEGFHEGLARMVSLLDRPQEGWKPYPLENSLLRDIHLGERLLAVLSGPVTYSKIHAGAKICVTRDGAVSALEMLNVAGRVLGGSSSANRRTLFDMRTGTGPQWLGKSAPEIEPRFVNSWRLPHDHTGPVDPFRAEPFDVVPDNRLVMGARYYRPIGGAYVETIAVLRARSEYAAAEEISQFVRSSVPARDWPRITYCDVMDTSKSTWFGDDLVFAVSRSGNDAAARRQVVA